MSPGLPLYNSRLSKTYVQYVRHRYPHIDIEAVLREADIALYQVEDPAHWFSQEDVDRFHSSLVRHTGETDISRHAGRYAVSSEVMGAAKQYILGLMTPSAIYHLMEKNYPLLSRGARVTVRKTGPHRVEIVAVPKPGVAEKAYQCENRSGFFEAFPTLFTDEPAAIEHPECFHRGAAHCRYIVTWKESGPYRWRRLRDTALLAGFFLSAAAYAALPFGHGTLVTLVLSILVGACAYASARLEKQRLVRTIEDQRRTAGDSLLQSEELYSNALLIQEMGQATSTILDVQQLVAEVMTILEKRLDFDRGIIMLANKEGTRLEYSGGYGHTREQERLLQETTFSLENPFSTGLFAVAMRERRPFLVNDILSLENSLSAKSMELARRLGARALICVPIVFEKASLGILAVDNSASKRPLRQSDLSLLLGVAAQLATSIINARSFERIQDSEKKYRELVETASGLILRVNGEGRITFANAFAQRMLGYEESHLIGREAASLILPPGENDTRSLLEFIGAMSRDPMRPATRESATALRSGQTAWIAWTYRPIFDETGGFRELLCIGSDITGLRQADQENRQLQIQLQRAQKMEAIGTLAGGVAHDLNNILSGIVSYPELLLLDLPEDSPLRRPIQIIKKSGERAAAIVQDLLTLARRGVENTEAVNLNQIVTEYLASPEFNKLALYHPRAEVETRLDPQLLNMVGSPVHLSKTVMNLVSNAAEAMPEGGTILLQTENRHLEPQKGDPPQAPQGDLVAFIIRDSGVGISPTEMEHIFEPFYTKKVMGRSGTGLGMAVVWGTVKDHRGKIDIQSRVGRGTEITLLFPATRRPLPSKPDQHPLEAARGKGERILVVDDIPEQRQIATEILVKLGYSVSTAASGEAALEHLREQPADLVVLDMIMPPGMDGLETFKRILALRPGQKTVIASGYSESVQVREAQQLGAGAYVKKPYLIQTFGQAVKAELER